MAEYRQIHTRIWKDSWFLELAAKKKLLFIYLFSNERACLAGLYDLSPKIMAFEADLSIDFVIQALDSFEAAGKIRREGNLIWIPNLMRYNAANLTSPKIQTHLRNTLYALTDCALKSLWIQHYNGMVDSEYHIDSLSIPIPEPESEQEQEPDHEQDSEPESDQESLGATRAPPEVIPDPATLTVQQIKALGLSGNDWQTISRLESKGKNRKSVIAYCKQMLDRPHPAILAFQEATGRYPRKPLWGGIVRVVGDDPDALEFWERVCKHYLACGWNSQNVKGMLEWYQKRELPAVQKPSRGARRQQQSAPADYARSEYAKATDAPVRAPPTEAERIWSEVVDTWRGSYPQLAEIRAIPGDAADGIMLSGNRQVVEPVKARLMERVQDVADNAAGRPLEIRWVGDTGEVE